MRESPVLIEPRRIPGDPEIGHPIILNLFEPYLDFLRKELKVRKSTLQRLRFPSMTHYAATVGGKKISLFGTPLGCPQAAIMLERLIAMGAKKILVFGCCGSLQPGLEIGQLVVPCQALGEEGTSAHYPLPKGEEAKADDEITRLCVDMGRQRNFKSAAGKVWTTDALFRETHEKTRRYSEMGLLAVEMEISALFTIAAFRKVRIGGVLVVSDELASLKWKTGFLSSAFWLASKKAARLAVDIALRLED
jgi:purine-nucleoside phosphorylase